ncbi:hypothetical protein ANO11243_026190 [Dothideomycetidae sp. 11243]|nr:hypothetical protein ANO11243_026190 [fungal sp. No.11243]
MQLSSTGSIQNKSSEADNHSERYIEADADNKYNRKSDAPEDGGDDVVFVKCVEIPLQERVKRFNGSFISRLRSPLSLTCDAAASKCSLCHSGQYAMFGSAIQDSSTPLMEGTQLCQPCTEQRQSIVRCEVHSLQKIIHPMGVNFQSMAERLSKNRIHKDDPWCSVCPAMADHTCGCGLYLCQLCASELTTRCQNSWTIFILDLYSAPTGKWQLGPRADLELLRPGGPMTIAASRGN